MLIEVIDVGTPVAVKKYHTIEVAYKADGKTSGKKLMSFLFPEVYETLSKASRGAVFEVTSVKNDAGYWDWVKVVESGSAGLPAPTEQGAAPRDFKQESKAVKSTYETAEERAARQILIVRQSSLSNAVATLAVGAKSITPTAVVALAKEYEDYVFGGTARERAEAAVAAIEDDVPL